MGHSDSLDFTSCDQLREAICSLYAPFRCFKTGQLSSADRLRPNRIKVSFCSHTPFKLPYSFLRQNSRTGCMWYFVLFWRDKDVNSPFNFFQEPSPEEVMLEYKLLPVGTALTLLQCRPPFLSKAEKPKRNCWMSEQVRALEEARWRWI